MMRFPLSQPGLGPLERAFVLEAFDSGWISGTGPFVSRFEELLVSRFGRRFVIATASGTTALEIALMAMDIGPGDEVIVPALTFAAPAAAVALAGATPVLCDIDPGNWTIDPAEAARLVTRRTRAVIAVDLMGHPCDFRSLAGLGVPVIEDAAQAHGAMAGGRAAGSFGLVSTFSFHANKAISTGEGGCIATDDEQLAGRMRLIVNHGMSPSRPYVHDVPGRNGRMTNLTAAIGCAQIERWDELVGRRGEIEHQYRRLIGRLRGTSKPTSSWASPSCWLYAASFSAADKAAILARARDRQIDARSIWPALSSLSLYAPGVRRPCEVSTSVAAHAIWLPTAASMSDADVLAIVEELAVQ